MSTTETALSTHVITTDAYTFSDDVNATTTTAAPPAQPAAKVEYVEVIIAKGLWMYAAPTILILGTIGNTLSVLVLSRKGMRSAPTSLYLIALAFVDTTVLYTGLLRWWLRALVDVDIRYLSDAGCKLHIFLVYLTFQLSAWILVAVTIERFISVILPFKSKQLCTHMRALLALTLIISSLVVLNLHFFWTRGLKKFKLRDGSTKSYCVLSDASYADFAKDVWPWIDFSVASVIPFSVMIICNTAIVIRLVHASYKRRTKMNVNKKNDKSVKMTTMTAMLLTISFIFLLTTSPIVIYLVGQDSWTKGADARKWAQIELIWATVNLLAYTNNAMNFLLYCVSGPRFRRELLGLFRRGLNRVGVMEDQSVTMDNQKTVATIED